MIKYPNGASFDKELKTEKRKSKKDKLEVSLSAAN